MPRFCCPCVGLNTVLLSFKHVPKENTQLFSSTCSWIEKFRATKQHHSSCPRWCLLLLCGINTMIKTCSTSGLVQWPHISDTAERDNLVSETRPKFKMFFLEEQPKSELSFQHCIQIREKLPWKFQCIQTGFLYGFSIFVAVKCI